MLFTDGENNRGRDPLDVARRIEGSRHPRPLHRRGARAGASQKPDVRALLQAIAQDGGRYFNATSAADLVAASKAIDTVEKGFLVNKVSVRDAPVYQWFAIPALIALAAAVRAAQHPVLRGPDVNARRNCRTCGIAGMNG